MFSLISMRSARSAHIRPAFSNEHLCSLEWLVAHLPEAGLSGTIDGIGNVLGKSPKAGPKLLAGSHLDTQAGWLDGTLGVVYALEAARVLNPDAAIRGAVEVAAWGDEEGHYEPPRDCRRPFGLSYAAMAGVSSMA